MKITYTIKANPLISRPFPETKFYNLDGCEVKWEANESGFFKGITISLCGTEIVGKNENGFILSEQDKVEEKIYRVASFCSNSIYKQTKLELIDADELFSDSPIYEAENKREEELLKNEAIIGYSSIGAMLQISEKLEPEKFMDPVKFNQSSALATYTDALRIQNPLRRYEQFFKVVEHYFDTHTKQFDQKVSAYASQFNSIFDEDKIKQLREDRNRCTHPQAKLGPYNSENIISLRTITSQLKDIKLLAEIFLENPVI